MASFLRRPHIQLVIFLASSGFHLLSPDSTHTCIDTAVEKIGKFQIKRCIGQGASGKVYLATDTFSSQDVALKVLDPEVVKHPDFARTNLFQFMNEASLAGKLAHPHIAAILEAWVDDNSGQIAVEYVPGGDLSQYTQPDKLLPPDSALEIAFKCCGALDYAFRQGIVHRDIKPANILVAGGTNIKVADFGAAFVAKRAESQIDAIGSPLYLSPEQARGEPLDYRSDMFSLGVVLYQLFTGHLPHRGTTLDELLGNIQKTLPPVPSSLRPELDAEIDRMLLRMLAKAPEDRYPSWADLALDIARIGGLSVYHSTIPDSEKFLSLKKIRLLATLDDAELWELVQIGKWSRVPPRTTIIKEGSNDHTLCFIGSGQVKVTKQGRLLNLLDAGECIGEMSFIKEGTITRQATVESMGDVLLGEYDKKAFDQVSLKCRYIFSQALMHALVDRLSLADARIIQSA